MIVSDILDIGMDVMQTRLMLTEERGFTRSVYLLEEDRMYDRMLGLENTKWRSEYLDFPEETVAYDIKEGDKFHWGC